MSSRNPNPIGKLTLVDCFQEVPTTRSRKVCLLPGANGEILLEEHHDDDPSPAHPGGQTRRWSLDRETLIALVKQHARSLSAPALRLGKEKA